MEHERSRSTCCSHCSNINHGVVREPMPLLWDEPKLWRQPVSVGRGQGSLLLPLEARPHLRV